MTFSRYCTYTNDQHKETRQLDTNTFVSFFLGACLSDGYGVTTCDSRYTLPAHVTGNYVMPRELDATMQNELNVDKKLTLEINDVPRVVVCIIVREAVK